VATLGGKSPAEKKKNHASYKIYSDADMHCRKKTSFKSRESAFTNIQVYIYCE